MILSPKAMASADFGQKPVCSGPISSSSACRTTASCLSASRSTGTRRTSTSSASCSSPFRTRPCACEPEVRQPRHARAACPERCSRREERPNLVFAPVTGIGYQGITINTNNGDAGEDAARPGQARAPGARIVHRPQRDQRGRGRGHLSAGRPASPTASPYNNPKFAAGQRDVPAAKQL